MHRKFLAATALFALAATAVPASALTITLRDVGATAATADAARGYRAAAAYWESVITTDVNVVIDTSFEQLGPNILGSTGSNYDVQSVRDVLQSIRQNGTSALDQVVKNNNPLVSTISMITPGYTNQNQRTGINNNTKVYDNTQLGANNPNSANNRFLGITTANGKALGFGNQYNPNDADAEISFSSVYANDFDFDPRNGIGANKIDFIGVAIHEFGHALGFLSGVDDYDFLGTGGPVANEICLSDGTRCRNLPAQQYAWGTTLDLFRYSNDPTNLVPGTTPVLDWTTGTASYFSINGGTTNLANFSTGSFNGDGSQASHWKANGTCSNFIGILNPYACDGTADVVTALDLAAFDAIGWNINVNVLANRGYTFTTAQVAVLAGVPEPMTWMLMIGGFGMVGAAMRRGTARSRFDPLLAGRS